ncbi:MAG TPA: hypothetical protein VGI76_09870 [Solirubrobacteraceae bacterium]
MTAYERRIPVRLIGAEMRYEPAVAQGVRVAIDHEHAPCVTGAGEHLARTTVAVGVATQQAVAVAMRSQAAARRATLSMGSGLLGWCRKCHEVSCSGG